MEIEYGDKSKPQAVWGRPERVRAIAEALTKYGIQKITVYFGGERFTFLHDNTYVVLDVKTDSVSTYRSHCSSVFENPASGHRDRRYISGKSTTAKIVAVVHALMRTPDHTA